MKSEFFRGIPKNPGSPGIRPVPSARLTRLSRLLSNGSFMSIPTAWSVPEVFRSTAEPKTSRETPSRGGRSRDGHRGAGSPQGINDAHRFDFFRAVGNGDQDLMRHRTFLSHAVVGVHNAPCSLGSATIEYTGSH